MNSVEINLTAKDQQVGEPWLWRLSREFDVRVTVQKANVDSDYGWVQIRLDGPLEEIQRATAWLMTTGLHVDALQRSVGA
ncbi:MAG: NIL domain-containing protein [Fimbriimonadaceae bacterium]|jgi:ABC-type methionine transport system ATPase subunit|nr:NIL domain-containing protein [Fimbriimonadaceae bacterium]